MQMILLTIFFVGIIFAFIGVICFTHSKKESVAYKAVTYILPFVSFLLTLIDFSPIANEYQILDFCYKPFEWLSAININSIFELLLIYLTVLISMRLHKKFSTKQS